MSQGSWTLADQHSTFEIQIATSKLSFFIVLVPLGSFSRSNNAWHFITRRKVPLISTFVGIVLGLSVSPSQPLSTSNPRRVAPRGFQPTIWLWWRQLVTHFERKTGCFMKHTPFPKLPDGVGQPSNELRILPSELDFAATLSCSFFDRRGSQTNRNQQEIVLGLVPRRKRQTPRPAKTALPKWKAGAYNCHFVIVPNRKQWLHQGNFLRYVIWVPKLMRFHPFSCVAFHVSPLQLLWFPSSLSFSVPIFLSPTIMRPSGLLSCKSDRSIWGAGAEEFVQGQRNGSFPALLMAATMMPRASSIPLERSIRDSHRWNSCNSWGWVQDEWHSVQIRTSPDILRAQTPLSPIILIYHQILPTTMQQIFARTKSRNIKDILNDLILGPSIVYQSSLLLRGVVLQTALTITTWTPERRIRLEKDFNEFIWQQVVPTHRYANQIWYHLAK